MEKIIEIFNENKKEIIYGAIIIFIVIILQIITFNYFKKSAQEVKANVPAVTYEETETPIDFYVDIKGEIVKPGSYKVDSDKRVIDVIKLAGGLTKNANTRANNLSKKLEDEMVIIIYSNEEITNFMTIKEEENQLALECNESNYNLKNNTCVEEEKKEDKNGNKVSLISINSATVEELMTLPSIGESKAKNIISYRETNGLFSLIEDIKNVPGIGDNIYDQIKDYITI